MGAGRNRALPCPSCGYDLRGSQVEDKRYRCPECGFVGTSFQINLTRSERVQRRSEILDLSMMLLVVVGAAGLAVAAHHGILGTQLSGGRAFMGIMLLGAFMFVSWRWFEMRWWGHLLFAAVPAAAWVFLRELLGGERVWVFVAIGMWTMAFEMIARRTGIRRGITGADDD